MAKFQTNAIIEAIVAGGLDKTACTYDFDDDGGGRITHAPSGSSFLLEGDINAYTVTMTVGDIPGVPAGPVFWSQIPGWVEGWARRVKDDMDTPNLLAELQRDREILTGARFEDVENTPFTPAFHAGDRRFESGWGYSQGLPGAGFSRLRRPRAATSRTNRVDPLGCYSRGSIATPA